MNKLEHPQIAIIGFGYVGKAIANLFRGHYKVATFDPNLNEAQRTEYEKKYGIFFLTGVEWARAAKLIIICVPTPMGENNQCDISIVEKTIKQLADFDKLDRDRDRPKVPILVKSTIPPGTTDMLKEKYGKRIVFSPEYAGESKYWTPYAFHTDMKACPWLTLGGDPEDTSYILDLMVPILGPTKTYRQTTAKAAEMAKYVENTFYALKVTFCNEIYEICEKTGLDYHEVRDLWLLDPRVNKMHTSVFKDDRGWGGKCYPKDINALVEFSKKNGYDPKLLSQVIHSNKYFRNKNICDHKQKSN